MRYTSDAAFDLAVIAIGFALIVAVYKLAPHVVALLEAIGG